jgi:hypothetical protein
MPSGLARHSPITRHSIQEIPQLAVGSHANSVARPCPRQVSCVSAAHHTWSVAAPQATSARQVSGVSAAHHTWSVAAPQATSARQVSGVSAAHHTWSVAAPQATSAWVGVGVAPGYWRVTHL